MRMTGATVAFVAVFLAFFLALMTVCCAISAFQQQGVGVGLVMSAFAAPFVGLFITVLLTVGAGGRPIAPRSGRSRPSSPPSPR